MNDKCFQDKPPNFKATGSDTFYLFRCFKCEPEKGKDNSYIYVGRGICYWCGWSYKEYLKENEHKPKSKITVRKIAHKKQMKKERTDRLFLSKNKKDENTKN